METKMMKRRDFLKISALAGVAVVAAACTPTAAPTVAPKTTEVPKATTAATTAATAAPKATEVPKATGFQGEIQFYAQSFTPTSALTNPDPKAPKYEALDTLAQEWEALHPGVKMTFLLPPAGEYWGWLSVQLIGGTGPDMFWIAEPTQYVDEGKVISLNDYLELPNKYTDDKTAWKDTFKSPYQTVSSPKGQYGGIPLDLVSTGVYVNIDLFKSVGIDVKAEIIPELGSPKDWATLMGWCKKFKEAGIFGFSLGGSLLNYWLEAVLVNQLFWHLTPNFDLLNYHDSPKNMQEDNVSQEEFMMQYGCANWKPFSEPVTLNVFELVKELSLYMPAGFMESAETAGAAASELFLTNQLAMFWDGSWAVGPIKQDSRRKFEFSSFWIPPITKESTPFAHDPVILPTGVGGYGAHNYGINPVCLKRGNVDECVDWLMYLTTPKNNEMVVNEVPSFIPSNKQAKSLPEVENLFVGETRLADAKNIWPVPLWWFGWENKWSDTYRREFTLYLLGDQDLKTSMTNLEAAAQEAYPELIRSAAIQYSKDGSWDLTQWKCQPTV